MAHKRKSNEEPNVSKSSKIPRVDDDSDEPYSAKGRRVHDYSEQPYSAIGQRVDDDSKKPYSAKGRRVDEDSKKPYSAKGRRVDEEKTLKQDKRRIEEESKSQQSANARIAQLSAQLENERKAKENALISQQSANARIAQLSAQLENERKAKENALIRLSSLASNKLRDNNPNIADLSDPNRPTKLSEQFSELYDNEWTDAFDDLQKMSGDKEDKEIISYLLCFVLFLFQVVKQIQHRLRGLRRSRVQRQVNKAHPATCALQPQHLIVENYSNTSVTDGGNLSFTFMKVHVDHRLLNQEINSVCSKLSASKLDTIQKAFANPAAPSDENKVPPETFKSIKDGIKSIAPKLLEDVRVHVHNHLKAWLPWESVSGCLQSENVKRYIDKCTEVCWYMSVQDPQLVMEGDKSPDGKFDSSKHREYTKKGPFEEFVVWPVLYLYQGGPLLSKGVAQGSKLEIK